MHVFLYEWITGGGLVDEPGRLPASLLAEGSAMITALAADFSAISGCRVSVLRDTRLHDLPLPGCETIEVHSTSDCREQFDRLAAAADWSMIVAPEFDGILQQAVRRVGEAGGRALNSSDQFITLAANKHQTAEHLRQAGVPAPIGRVLAEDEPKLPTDFDYPAVLKPIDGAGSQHTLLVSGAADEPAPYPWRRRLERFHAGRPASVGVLCGPKSRVPLPACWQHLSSDGRFSYRGGAVIGEAPLAERAAALALRALDVMPPALGYVGVDLVLGNAPDGSEDVVIEINPRLTTSYVGLRRAVQENLSQAMLDVAGGLMPRLTVHRGAVEFSADGAVWTPS
jgi:predicted ATP-grasp superfamily ATP-dependent carboligase